MIKPRDFIYKINIAQTLLGLDFGDKTIGIAVSDKSKTIATPIITIKRKGTLIDIEKLLSAISELAIVIVAVVVAIFIYLFIINY